jgi:protein phosphatase
MGSERDARIVERSGESDLGRKRQINQDRLLAEAPLFAVADGMGGHKGGEVAAGMAVETLRERRDLWTDSEPGDALLSLVKEANGRIFSRASEEPGLKGMGTTLTAALVHDDAVTIAHVGDSRAYRLRGGQLELLTEDHSFVAELIRSGAVTPEEAEKHPQRSLVLRALGSRAEVEADIRTHGAADRDVFRLCSDGLTKMVPDAQIVEILGHAADLDAAADRLIEAANERGGEDNVTVCLFRLAISAEEKRRGQTTVVDHSVISRVATKEREQA